MTVLATTPDEDPVIADINTTPLIDVMLVLLIMFIITIPIQTHAVRMNVGAADPVHVPPKPPEVVLVALDFDGRISWNGESVDATNLEARLQALARQPNPPAVHVRPDPLVDYRHVAAVLSTSQRVGVTRLGIVGNERFL